MLNFLIFSCDLENNLDPDDKLSIFTTDSPEGNFAAIIRLQKASK